LREEKVEGWKEHYPAIYSLPKLRVLCVDDDCDTADSTGILLELYGCEVAVSYDADAAFATALHFKPDVCLIDLNMPLKNGCELAMRLRTWSSGLPLCLIAVSAYGSDSVRKTSLAAGFYLHIVKPIEWEELLNELVEIERNLGRPGYISSRLDRLAVESRQ
jgi:CheY-like chemotaxis protein